MRENDHINLIKLCVGAESVEDLRDWIDQRAKKHGDGFRHVHVTRMWPKQQAKLLRGGSLYWVIKGVVQARQRIVALEEVITHDGVRRCAIVMDPKVIRTAAAARRPFQGWRYLAQTDAPPDLPEARPAEQPLPAKLEQALAEMGLR